MWYTASLLAGLPWGPLLFKACSHETFAARSLHRCGPVLCVELCHKMRHHGDNEQGKDAARQCFQARGDKQVILRGAVMKMRQVQKSASDVEIPTK